MMTLLLVLILPIAYLNLLAEPTLPIIVSVVCGIIMEVVGTKSSIIGFYKLGEVLLEGDDNPSFFQNKVIHSDEDVDQLLSSRDDVSLSRARDTGILMIRTYILMYFLLQTADASPISIHRPLSIYLFTALIRWIKKGGEMNKVGINALKIADSLKSSRHAMSERSVNVLKSLMTNSTIRL